MSDINKIKESINEEKEKLSSSVDQSTILDLQKQNDKYSIEINNLQISINKTEKEMSKVIMKGNFQKNIDSYKQRIKEKETLIARNNQQILSIRNNNKSKNESLFKALDNKLNSQTASLEQKLKNINDIENEKSKLLKNLSSSKTERVKEIQNLESERQKVIEKIEIEAPKNQVYRVATWFKGYFSIDLEKRNVEINKQIQDLENSKIYSSFLFIKIKKTSSLKQIETIDNQIKNLENQILINNEKIKLSTQNTEKDSYTNMPQSALTFAFWAWFGVLSFIISVTGTMLAFGSLNLQDPRMHEISDKPGAGIGGVFLRISKLLIAIRQYYWKKLKLLFKPNIVEKEIEVEKIVEKIVDRPVEIEKIKYVTQEVPKEVIKKIYVHVPFPTDDLEVIKRTYHLS